MLIVRAPEFAPHPVRYHAGCTRSQPLVPLELRSTILRVTHRSEYRYRHPVAVAAFSDPAAELKFESTFRAEHFPPPERTLVFAVFMMDAVRFLGLAAQFVSGTSTTKRRSTSPCTSPSK